MDLLKALAQLEKEGTAAIAEATGEDLERLRTELLGRKGRLTSILRGLGQLSPEERPRVGAEANRVKEALTKLLDERLSATAPAPSSGAAIDLSMPGRARWRGGRHPITQVVDEICDIFSEL